MPTTSTRICDRESHTTVEVARPLSGGRVTVRMAAAGATDRPVVRPMLISADDSGAVVSLVPEGALLLAGDAVRIDVRVGAGARLTLVEPAGTVAYAMAGGDATWDVRVDLEPAATLVWAGEPFVVAEGARVRRRTYITWGWGARVALRETLVLGRHGERPGTLTSELAVASNLIPVLRESLEVGPGSSRLLLGRARVVGTVLLLGGRLAPAAWDTGQTGTRLDLAAEGTMVRGLARAAHRAVPRGAWEAARQLCTSPVDAVPGRPRPA